MPGTRDGETGGRDREGKKEGRTKDGSADGKMWAGARWLGGGGMWGGVASESKNRKPFMSVWMAGQHPLPVVSALPRAARSHFSLSLFLLFFFFAHGEQ